jgi:hypothetical protein
MAYEFSIVRLRKNASATLSFPADLVQLESNPIAGPFDALSQARLIQAIERFPGACPTPGIKNCFEIETLGGGRLEVWMASDGHLFIESQAGLELTQALFFQLRSACDDLALEDAQLGVLHSSRSFAAWLSACEASTTA